MLQNIVYEKLDNDFIKYNLKGFLSRNSPKMLVPKVS